MAVLMIGEVQGLTAEVYNGMLEGLKPTLQAAEGFIAHAGGPSPEGGWRVVEMWDTEENGQAWFDEFVRPNLPPEIVPQRTFYPVDAAFSK
jgi:hypothetical protein